MRRPTLERARRALRIDADTADVAPVEQVLDRDEAGEAARELARCDRVDERVRAEGRGVAGVDVAGDRGSEPRR